MFVVGFSDIRVTGTAAGAAAGTLSIVLNNPIFNPSLEQTIKKNNKRIYTHGKTPDNMPLHCKNSCRFTT
jgi:hypothetical protein